VPLTKETEDYITGWKNQVASYVNKDDVIVMFDKFRTLYQIYNRLYNDVSLRLGKPQTDKQGATSHVVQYLTANALASSIEANDETKNAELQLSPGTSNPATRGHFKIGQPEVIC
jgi:hypothetical protein